jgi:ribosomal protein S18 acetylase RimI-like enzyme
MRMSVAADLRRQRIGTRLLQRLCAEARQLGLHRIELSTEAAWQAVIAFYEHFGFHITGYHEGKWSRGVTLAFDLPDVNPPDHPE